jgi:hypothetical protein
MDIQIIKNEITSPAFKEITNALSHILDKIQNRDIDYKQGVVEITACKHIIQSLAIDWAFNRKVKKIKG